MSERTKLLEKEVDILIRKIESLKDENQLLRLKNETLQKEFNEAITPAFNVQKSEMSDNEIIKALECCIVYESCEGCPCAEDNSQYCLKATCKNALDLLNRQKAEIERLEKSKGFTDLGKLYSEIKSEARKEFWDKLKEKRYGGTYPYVLITEGDYLLKEMEED